MIIDAPGPSIWTLEHPGTFLTYIWGLPGSSARYSCPAINIRKVCSGRQVLILNWTMTHVLGIFKASRPKPKDRIVEVTFQCPCKYHRPH